VKKLTLKEMALDIRDFHSGRSLKRVVESQLKAMRENRSRGVKHYLNLFGWTLNEEHSGYYAHEAITDGLVPEVAAFAVVARVKRIEFERLQEEQKQLEKV
jgi:hypothetical protein